MIVIVVVLLALNYWVSSLVKLQIPGTVINILYIYLIINAAAASPFIYLEHKEKKAAKKLCPKCGEELERVIEYKCEKCGTLKFEWDNSLNLLE